MGHDDGDGMFGILDVLNFFFFHLISASFVRLTLFSYIFSSSKVVEGLSIPVISSTQVYYVDERSVINTVVTSTLECTDIDAQDSRGYTILQVVSILSDDVGGGLKYSSTGPFAVPNPGGPGVGGNGGLWTIGELDYEEVVQYNLTVACTDALGASDAEVVQIKVNDEPDSPFQQPEDAAVNLTVAENMPSGTVIGYVTVSDQDAADLVPLPEGMIRFEFSDPTSPFTAAPPATTMSGKYIGERLVGTKRTRFQLVTTASFNFEDVNMYVVPIVVSDIWRGRRLGHPSIAPQLTVMQRIFVTDVNDRPTLVSPTASSIVVREDAPLFSFVTNVTAKDEDRKDILTIVDVTEYGSEIQQAPFMLVPVSSVGSGVFRSTFVTFDLLDYERVPSYSLKVDVSDGNGGNVTGIYEVTVEDVNDLEINSVVVNTPDGIGSTSGGDVVTLSGVNVGSIGSDGNGVIGGSSGSGSSSGASLVTPSAFGDAWGSAVTSLSDVYGDGGSFTAAYNASTFKWSLTGHPKLFDGVHVMAKTMNLPNSFFAAVEFSNYGTEFQNRGIGYLTLYDVNDNIVEGIGVGSMDSVDSHGIHTQGPTGVDVQRKK